MENNILEEYVEEYLNENNEELNEEQKESLRLSRAFDLILNYEAVLLKDVVFDKPFDIEFLIKDIMDRVMSMDVMDNAIFDCEDIEDEFFDIMKYRLGSIIGCFIEYVNENKKVADLSIILEDNMYFDLKTIISKIVKVSIYNDIDVDESYFYYETALFRKLFIDKLIETKYENGYITDMNIKQKSIKIDADLISDICNMLYF